MDTLRRTMDSDISQDLHKELTCPICLNCLMNPVTVGCGHSFCWSCLCVSWEKAESSAQCPVCKEQSQHTNFKTDILLKNLVSIVRKASLRQFLSSGDNLCELHEETKQIFCEDNRSLLCVHCSSSEEHQAHRHCLAEEAAEESRAKLLSQITSLWEKIQEIQRNLNKDSRVSDDWICYVYHQRDDIIRAAHHTLRRVLYEEEKEHLKNLEKDGLKMFEQLRKHQAEVVEKKATLRAVYEELVDLCHKPDVEVLQELGDKLTRSEQAQLHMPQPLQPEVPKRPITGLMDRLNCFRVKICITNEISNHNIRLFDDIRSLKFVGDRLQVSLDPGTSNYFAAWGDQAFGSGKYYWELYVDRSWDWAVGVCKETWIRKPGTLTESQDTFLLLCVKEDHGYTLWTTAPMTRQYIAKPLGRVGVFLDADSGSLSFVDVANHSLIWTYPDGKFNFPVRPFIYTGHP